MDRIHGNTVQKWFVSYNQLINSFMFQNTEVKSEYYRLPVVRDIKLDLALYLRRLSATDDELPISIRNDTYKNMVEEILDGSDPYIWIRKGRWETTVLKIVEVDNFLKSNKTFKEFLKK